MPYALRQFARWFMAFWFVVNLAHAGIAARDGRYGWTVALFISAGFNYWGYLYNSKKLSQREDACIPSITGTGFEPVKENSYMPDENEDTTAEETETTSKSTEETTKETTKECDDDDKERQSDTA